MKIKHLTLLMLLGLIWGSAFSIARFVVTNGIPPLVYAFYQSFGPALLLLAYALLKRLNHAFTPKILLYFFITGLMGIAIPNTIRYIIAVHIDSGLIAIIVNTVPLFIYIFSLLLKEDRFSWQKTLGIMVGSTGIFYILLSMMSTLHDAPTGWVLLGLLSPCCYALCAIYIAKNSSQKIDSIILAIGMLLASTILLTPIVLATTPMSALILPINDVSMAVFGNMFLSAIGYILLFELLKTAGSIFFSMTDGIVILTGLIWGNIFFHEPLHRFMIVGASLIFIAITLIARTKIVVSKKQ